MWNVNFIGNPFIYSSSNRKVNLRKWERKWGTWPNILFIKTSRVVFEMERTNKFLFCVSTPLLGLMYEEQIHLVLLEMALMISSCDLAWQCGYFSRVWDFYWYAFFTLRIYIDSISQQFENVYIPKSDQYWKAKFLNNFESHHTKQ